MEMDFYGADEKIIDYAKNYPELYLARVISGSRGIYRLGTANGEISAELSGRFRFQTEDETLYPAVGDYVMVDRVDDNGGNGMISLVLPRKSVFIRKAAGLEAQAQVVAANIDTVFICMSLNQNFNLRRLERYLSLAWESGAAPVVVLTKTDLCQDYDSMYSQVVSVAFGVDIIGVSSLEEKGCDSILPYIRSGKTIALIGSSGVGKSTLINHLLGRTAQDTQQTGFEDKGRHTTTRRELIALPQGGFMIDTPGMRELGMWEAAEGVDRTFSDVEEYISRCRFSNCSHSSEPGCAVREAIEAGALSQERFLAYMKLKTENSFVNSKADYLEQKKEKFKKIAKINKAKK